MSPTTQNCVSIQLPLGGHSFSSSALSGIATDNSVSVCAVVDTAKCVVVPREHFAEERAEEILRSSGIAIGGDEVVVSSTEAAMIAVMAMSTKCYAALLEHYGERLCFTSPLLNSPMPEQGSVIHLSSKTLYVRVANDGLRLIEAMTVESDADILYMLESINKVYNIYNMYARAEGDTKRLLTLCKRSFKNIVCE